MLERKADAEICQGTVCGSKLCGQPLAGLTAVAFQVCGEFVVTHLMCAPPAVRKAYHSDPANIAGGN